MVPPRDSRASQNRLALNKAMLKKFVFSVFVAMMAFQATPQTLDLSSRAVLSMSAVSTLKVEDYQDDPNLKGDEATSWTGALDFRLKKSFGQDDVTLKVRTGYGRKDSREDLDRIDIDGMYSINSEGVFRGRRRDVAAHSPRPVGMGQKTE